MAHHAPTRSACAGAASRPDRCAGRRSRRARARARGTDARRGCSPLPARAPPERWVKYYAELGVEQIGVGAIVLRRRSGGSSWIQGFQFGGGRGAGSEQLQRIFAANDFVTSCSGAEQVQRLWSEAWRLVENHRVEQAMTYRGGACEEGMALISDDPGFGLNAQVDTRVLPVLVACDGTRPLADLIREAPVPVDLDPRASRGLCLDTVRDLIGRGYLVSDGRQPV